MCVCACVRACVCVCVCGTMAISTCFWSMLVYIIHGLLNCEIGGLDCRVITREYNTYFVIH